MTFWTIYCWFFGIYAFLVFLNYIFDFTERNSLLVSQLKVPKTKFVWETLYWCEQQLGTTNKRYGLDIKYYYNQKYLGLYYFYNKTITLYIGEQTTVYDLVNTIIHEYTHHLQMISNKDSVEYDTLLKTCGYDNHPMEVEARTIADKYNDACYDFLAKKFNF